MGAWRGRFLHARPIQASQGALIPVRVPTPALGQDWTFTFPSGYLWRIVAIRYRLATSAQVANRVAVVSVTDQDGLKLVTMHATTSIAASGSDVISMFNAGNPAGLGGGVLGAAEPPEVMIPTGYKLVSETAGLQTEDQLSEVALWLEQFEDRADVFAEGEEHLHALVRIIEEARSSA
jgi:hypothetical protein